MPPTPSPRHWPDRLSANGRTLASAAALVASNNVGNYARDSGITIPADAHRENRNDPAPNRRVRCCGLFASDAYHDHQRNRRYKASALDRRAQQIVVRGIAALAFVVIAVAHRESDSPGVANAAHRGSYQYANAARRPHPTCLRALSSGFYCNEFLLGRAALPLRADLQCE